MTNERMTRAELIRWLGDAIRAETDKPFDEIDYEFVEECGCLLDELMGNSNTLSEEEITEKLAKLKPDTVSNVRKKVGIQHRKVWRVLIAAAVVLCLSITVMAVPSWRQAILTALRLDVGESVMEDEITYINLGNVSVYSTMDELITAEDLGILSFNDPDEVLKIIAVDYMNEISQTFITFNNPTINFLIRHNVDHVDEAIIETSTEELSTPYFTAYIVYKHDTTTPECISYFIYKNNLYQINCSDRNTLISLLTYLYPGD